MSQLIPFAHRYLSCRTVRFQFLIRNCLLIPDLKRKVWWTYLPMQNVEKMLFRMSSMVVSPVMASSGRRVL